MEGREDVRSESQVEKWLKLCSGHSAALEVGRIREQIYHGQHQFCRIFSCMFILNRIAVLNSTFFFFSLWLFCVYYKITYCFPVYAIVCVCKQMKSYRDCSAVLGGVMEGHCLARRGAHSSRCEHKTDGTARDIRVF